MVGGFAVDGFIWVDEASTSGRDGVAPILKTILKKASGMATGISPGWPSQRAGFLPWKTGPVTTQTVLNSSAQGKRAEKQAGAKARFAMR